MDLKKKPSYLNRFKKWQDCFAEDIASHMWAKTWRNKAKS